MPVHEYLKEHIIEEINGAIDYLGKAIELKKTHPMMSEKFYRMAEMEIEHANCMTKMFSSMKRDESVQMPDYSNMQEEIINIYATSMSKIEHMKKLYWNN